MRRSTGFKESKTPCGSSIKSMSCKGSNRSIHYKTRSAATKRSKTWTACASNKTIRS